MRTTSMIASMLGLSFAGSAAAAMVDPFTTASSVNNGASATYADSSSAFSGGLWNYRTVSAQVLDTAKASSQASVSGGNFVFAVSQVGTSQNSTQRAKVAYSMSGGGAGPDFTNFTSLTFNYTATFTFGVRVAIAGMTTGSYVQLQNIAAGSGTLTFTAAQFAINPTLINDVATMSVELFRNGGNTSGSVTISNLEANGVPAPGAIALLGAAGTIGFARRRR